MGEDHAGAAERAHLPDFLRTHRDAILDAWVDRVRSLSPARCLSDAAVLDHFGQVIDRIAQSVASAGPPALGDPPKVHSKDRLGHGFDLRDVVHEYAILRRCIHELWRRETGEGMPFDELDRMETAIDVAIAEATDEYARAQSRTQANLAAERREAEEERQKAMAELHAEQRRLEQVLQQLPAGVIIADATGKLVFGNDQVTHIWRRPLIPSANIEEYGEWPGFDPKDGHSLAPEEWPLARALMTGETVFGHQVEILRGDGTRGYVSASGAPLRDEEGRVVGGVVAFHDITAQKEAEKQRDRLMEESRFLSEVTEILSLSLDYDKTLARLTQLLVPRLADWCSVDMVKEDGTLGDYVAVAHGDPAKVEIARALRERYPPPLDSPRGLARVLRTGEPEWYPEITDEMNVAAAQDPEHLSMVRGFGLRSYLSVPLSARGRTFGAMSLAMAESGRRLEPRDLALAQDIARRAAYAIDNARLYRMAREASAVRDNLLAIVSHDLKNLLGTIVLSGATISRGLSHPERLPKVQRATEVIERTATQMDRLIHDLVDVAHIQMGRLAMVKGMHDPGAIAAEAAEAFGPQAQEKGLALACTSEHDLPPVSCDKERVLQALGNLLSNAIKVTPSGGRIAVRCERRGEHVVFAVSDTGPGIAEGELPHVFERYFRGQRTEYKGMGLGLAIVKGIVDAHGGWVKADSRLGHGATFAFGLPVATNAQLLA